MLEGADERGHIENATRVLLVEDDNTSAKAVTSVLSHSERCVYSIEHVQDLSNATERLCESLYDVVLLDLNLPDSRGVATLSEVRDLAKAPIVVLTGDTTVDLGEAVLRGGAQDFLTKGKYDRATLERSIEYAVQRFRIEADNRKAIAELVEASVRYEKALKELEHLNETIRTESESRQQAVAAFRASEQRHRLLFDEAPVPLWEVDFSRAKALFDKVLASGTKDLGEYFKFHPAEVVHCFRLARTLGINKAAVELYAAVNKEDLADRFFATFTGESFNAFIEGLIALAAGAKRFERETTVQSLDGKDIHVVVRWSVAPGSEHDLSRVLYSTVDITERKRSEQERAMLGAAIEQLNETVIVTDVTGEIRYVNPAFEKSTGHKRGEAFGNDLRMLLDSGKQGVEFYDDLQKKITGGEVWRGRMTSKKRDGTLYEAEATISPVRGDGGAITNVVVVSRDVTHEVALERQLAQAQKMEAIGQLAAGIAHEINTPTQYVGDNTRFFLEAFQAFFDFIGDLEKAGDEIGETARAALAAATAVHDLDYYRSEIPVALAQTSEGVERIAAIVTAMKEFSHPGTAEKQASDLNQGVRSTVTVARNEWKYVADVELDLDEALPPVQCFLGEINQVILNMIVNAVHAIEAKVGKGGDRGKITLSTCVEGESAVIRITDTGCGIPEEIRGRIFEPFFTTKGVGKGSGQGLFIAYSTLVDKHGGSIDVRSEVGVGTTFIIRLPLKVSRSNVEAGSRLGGQQGAFVKGGA
jgi:PAS domain S-box-containing protein